MIPFPSKSVQNAMWQTPVSMVSPCNSTPAASSLRRAASTSGTRARPEVGTKGRPTSSGRQVPTVRFEVSNSTKTSSGVVDSSLEELAVEPPCLCVVPRRHGHRSPPARRRSFVRLVSAVEHQVVSVRVAGRRPCDRRRYRACRRRTRFPWLPASARVASTSATLAPGARCVAARTAAEPPAPRCRDTCLRPRTRSGCARPAGGRASRRRTRGPLCIARRHGDEVEPFDLTHAVPSRRNLPSGAG